MLSFAAISGTHSLLTIAGVLCFSVTKSTIARESSADDAHLDQRRCSAERRACVARSLASVQSRIYRLPRDSPNKSYIDTYHCYISISYAFFSRELWTFREKKLIRARDSGKLHFSRKILLQDAACNSIDFRFLTNRDKPRKKWLMKHALKLTCIEISRIIFEDIYGCIYIKKLTGERLGISRILSPRKSRLQTGRRISE